MAASDWEESELGEDIEQILAAEADGLFDLSPATRNWLLDTLDAAPEASPLTKGRTR